MRLIQRAVRNGLLALLVSVVSACCMLPPFAGACAPGSYGAKL
jgi:hypothetical protein